MKKIIKKLLNVEFKCQQAIANATRLVLTVVVVLTSSNSSARWHGQTHDYSMGHGHAHGAKMKDKHHSKMVECSANETDSGHSKTKESQYIEITDCDETKDRSGKNDHHKDGGHGH